MFWSTLRNVRDIFLGPQAIGREDYKVESLMDESADDVKPTFLVSLGQGKDSRVFEQGRRK